MRIFTVDQGNSNHSIYEWDNNQSRKVEFVDGENLPVFVSNVGKKNFPGHFIELNKIKNLHQKLDMPIQYQSTLGIDRLIAAYALYKNIAPQSKILIIDSGTYLTMDLLNNTGYKGGMILPGNDLLKVGYQKAFNFGHYNHSLNAKFQFPFQTTEECLSSSISYMLLATVEKIIVENNIDQIYLTGGNAEFNNSLLNNLKNKNISITTNNNLVHQGLYAFSKYFYNNQELFQ